MYVFLGSAHLISDVSHILTRPKGQAVQCIMAGNARLCEQHGSQEVLDQTEHPFHWFHQSSCETETFENMWRLNNNVDKSTFEEMRRLTSNDNNDDESTTKKGDKTQKTF